MGLRAWRRDERYTGASPAMWAKPAGQGEGQGRRGKGGGEGSLLVGREVSQRKRGMAGDGLGGQAWRGKLPAHPSPCCVPDQPNRTCPSCCPRDGLHRPCPTCREWHVLGAKGLEARGARATRHAAQRRPLVQQTRLGAGSTPARARRASSRAHAGGGAGARWLARLAGGAGRGQACGDAAGGQGGQHAGSTLCGRA